MTASKEDPHQSGLVIKLNAKWITYIHTLLGYAAFFSALIVACNTHYYQIVKNEHWGYPEEWFPSVSASTGDWYPARSIFQIFIAATSGFRFSLIFLFYLITNKPDHFYPKIHAIMGVIRSFACGGFTYITSSEDHDMHDVSMIAYIVLTLPWMLGCITLTQNSQALKYRKGIISAFFFTLLPMAYFFVQHKVYAAAGAYTIYAFFEWSLIIYDIAFDGISLIDFSGLEIRIVDVTGQSGYLNIATGSSIAKKAKENISRKADIVSHVGTLSNIMLAADSYLAFVYWSMLTSLALTIWYFPLWHMGISGYEAFLLVTVSPVLLGIPFVQDFISSNRGVFHLLSLSGVAAYLFVDPVTRLVLVSLGVAVANLTWASTWIENRENPGRLERDAHVWTLGLIFSSVLKMAWWTNNPIWPIMHKENGGWNLIGLILAILASLQVTLNGFVDEDKKSPRKRKQPQQKAQSEHWIFAAAGFGSLLFALHSLLSDTSIIMRWVYRGYPDTGPLPVPWGPATIIAMSLGLVLSTNRKIVTSLPWYVVGCVSCACMYYYPGWNGYYAGLILSVYLVSLVPTFIRSITQQSPGRTLFTSMMIYNILCLAHVWVVAYAFVPAGEYLREHTDYVLFAMMALIGAGVRAASQRNTIRSVRSITKAGLAVAIVMSFIVAYSRVPAEAPEPYHPKEKLLTAGIWTIHFGLDNDMWASEYRMRDVIKELELDVVGLLESDLGRIIMGNRDLTQFLAEDLKMYADYGPGPSKHTWGCAMLSKFPILNSTHHLLPSPVGELACAIHATLDVYGKHVDVIVSHNGQEEDPEDRRLQTTELARIMRESPNPFVFLGYVVTKPLEGNYWILMKDGHVNDIDPTDDDRWCEYIAYRGLKRTGYARVSHGGITDTEIQVGKFQVIDGELNEDGLNTRTDENDVPSGLRFPQIFRGDGIRGHRYHVFDEPRYFK